MYEPKMKETDNSVIPVTQSVKLLQEMYPSRP